MLALHHTKEYDLANALNLGIMADLAYIHEFSTDKDERLITSFFEQKCRDLSCIPQFAEYPNYFHTLAVDVPFRERYLKPQYLNTAHPGDGNRSNRPEGDSRLFTVECGAHVLVGWCGTNSGSHVVTDFSFAPEHCPSELDGRGSVAGGFPEAYQLMKRKYGDKIDALRRDLRKRSKPLFICGYSLGGALALLYAAEMKDVNPVLYTYGIPRTFTRLAVAGLTGVTHYRHVNDNDTVPQVPPDRDMERDIGLKVKRDPYWHHGNVVAFLRAEQCHIRRQQNQRSGEPFPVTISSVERVAVKLFVVPSLNDECLNASGEHQVAFTQCLAHGELTKRFPQGENLVSSGSPTKLLNHFMAAKYLPYIHNQVLELADPAREMERKAMRTRFREAAGDSAAEHLHPDEVARNRIFLSLQDLLPVSLRCQRDDEAGRNALSRFAMVTEEEVELSH